MWKQFFFQLLLYPTMMCGVFFLQCTSPPTSEKEARRLSDSGVDGDQPHTEKPSATTPVNLSLQKGQTIVYLLRWSWHDARWDENSKAYVFQNNLGYTIGIQAGYVGAAALQMVVCEGDESTDSKLGMLPTLLFPLRWGIRAARADHGFTNDSSFVGTSLVELIHRTEDVLFGKGPGSGHDYCKVHILYAPLNQKAADDYQVKRSSVILKGWYQAPHSQEKVTIDASSPLNGGSLITLQGPPQDATQKPPSFYQAAATVTLIRAPVKAFEDIDFARLSSVEFAYQFLKQLTQATTAHITES